MTSALFVSALWLFASPQESADVHERLGRTYEAKGDLEKAAAEYERASELDRRQEPYFQAAHVRLLREQFDAAKKILERGRKQFLRTTDIAPEVQQPHMFLSRMLDQTEDSAPTWTWRFFISTSGRSS